MPIVSLKIIKNDDSHVLDVTDVHEISDRLGKLFDSPVGSTWVNVNYVDKNMYAENGVPKVDTPSPIFVEILKRTLPKKTELSIEAKQVNSIISGITKVPAENIHILYLPDGNGRIAFGGEFYEDRH